MLCRFVLGDCRSDCHNKHCYGSDNKRDGYKAVINSGSVSNQGGHGTGPTLGGLMCTFVFALMQSILHKACQLLIPC